jgi:hypothetical protein
MSLINTLEQKFGRFAVPRIITVLAGFQVLNWFLIKLVPEFFEKLAFRPDAILDGEVWRLFSYVLLPGSTGILWLLCIGFMFMLNDGLEQAWGSFRLNLYLLAGIVCISAGGLIFGFSTTGAVLWVSVLFAFATYFPNEEILLYFIIPLKIKWIAWFTGALLLIAFATAPLRQLDIFFSLLNYLVVFGPGVIRMLRHRSGVAARRRQYETAQAPEDTALHRCSRCGRTDTAYPQLEFRVTVTGEDICSECRAKSSA